MSYDFHKSPMIFLPVYCKLVDSSGRPFMGCYPRIGTWCRWVRTRASHQGTPSQSVQPEFRTTSSFLASRSVFGTIESRQLPIAQLIIFINLATRFHYQLEALWFDCLESSTALDPGIVILRLDRVLPLWERNLTLAMSQSFNQVNKQIKATRESNLVK